MVADSSELAKLGWRPELNDLSTMIEHAYRWEENLAARRRSRHVVREQTIERAVAAI